MNVLADTLQRLISSVENIERRLGRVETGNLKTETATANTVLAGPATGAAAAPAYRALVAADIPATFPSTGIVMFPGACPAGWTRYTALDAKYPKGAPAGVTTPLNTGGALTHTHTFSGSTAAEAAHTHTGPSHTHTGPSHTHAMVAGTPIDVVWGPEYGFSSGGVIRVGSVSTSEDQAGQVSTTTAADGAGATGAAGTGATGAGASHSHGAGTLALNSPNHEPSYKEVVFCQKD